MVWKRPPRRPLALEGGDHARLRGRRLGGEIVLGGIGFEVLELQLHLVEQATRAFGAGAVLLAPQFGDLQLEVRDHRLGRALAGLCVDELGLDGRCAPLGFADLPPARSPVAA